MIVRYEYPNRGALNLQRRHPLGFLGRKADSSGWIAESREWNFVIRVFPTCYTSRLETRTYNVRAVPLQSTCFP